MRAFILPAVLFATALATGCTGTVGYGYTGTVSNVGYGPELVYAAPGVQVIADFDEPIFFVDGFYWRSVGATWYRSTYHTGGWVYAPPPPAIQRIERPRDYIHYRPQGWVSRRPTPVVRDHRRFEVPRQEPPRREPPRRPGPPPPPPHDRDRGDRDHRR